MNRESLGSAPDGDGYPHGPAEPAYAQGNWAFGSPALVEGPGLDQHTQPAGPYDATDAIADGVVSRKVTVEPGALVEHYVRTEIGMRGPYQTDAPYNP